MTGTVTAISSRPRQTMIFEGIPQQLDEELRGHFNTFRHGTKWMTQVRVGDIIALSSKDGKHSYGRAAVTFVVCGELRDMLMQFSDENHATDDPDELRGILHTVYGKAGSRNGETYTVVYMVRLRDD